MPIASAKCRQTPALIDGLSWSALALVLAYCALTSLESMLSPHMGVFGSGREMVLSWLVRIPIFMVMGVTVLITALVVLNAAGRAGRLNPVRSEEHTSELQSLAYLVCRLLLEKKKKNKRQNCREQKQRNKHRNMFYKHHTNQQPTIPRTVHNHESRISYQIALVDTRATMSNAT